jgi:hypothetical protein
MKRKERQEEIGESVARILTNISAFMAVIPSAGLIEMPPLKKNQIKLKKLNI